MFMETKYIKLPFNYRIILRRENGSDKWRYHGWYKS